MATVKLNKQLYKCITKRNNGNRLRLKDRDEYKRIVTVKKTEIN